MAPRRLPARQDTATAETWTAGLDLGNAAHAGFVAQFGSRWASIGDAPLRRHRSERTLAVEAGRMRLWERWATLPAAEGGGGICREPDALSAAPLDVLADAVYQWWWWLCADVEADHPLLRSGVPKLGDRRVLTSLRGETVGKCLRGVRAWGRLHDIDEDRLLRRVTSANGDERPDPRAPKVRIDVSVEAVGAAAELLASGGIPLAIADEQIAKLWHLRQRAALLVQVRGVNRVMEVGQLAPSRTEVVPRTPPLLLVRLGRTKTGGRDVLLAPTGTDLCAIEAIADLWEFAFAIGLGDELVATGRWLPRVHLKPGTGARLRAATYAAERSAFLRVMRAVGVIDTDIDGDIELFGTHALRRVLPTAAGRAGWPLARIARLGGGAWAPSSLAPATYVTVSGAGVQAAVLDDMGGR